MRRRNFLAGLVAVPASAASGGSPRRRILLRSSWQTANIGDIGHTPGVLHLLEEQLPGAEVWLWPKDVSGGVDAMLRRRFPMLRILGDEGEVDEAFERCDLMLHGSGPTLVAEAELRRWRERTGKPYGVFGITLNRRESTSTRRMAGERFERFMETLNGAAFVFLRDGVSLEVVREAGCESPVVEFGPDGAFAADVRDDRAAERFLARHGLEAGRFLCCIPRLRYTPYWRIAEPPREPDPDKHARNEAMKERDHAPLREAIARVVGETGMKVLLCPEDRTQMAVGREMIFDKLPAAVRERVVWREDYWLTDEALSTYVRSAGLFGHEMHSPIMAVGNGVPAIVCRWAEQSSKGFMWRDIGLGEWLFDMDEAADRERLPEAVLALARDPEAAREKAAAARRRVAERQRRMVEVLAAALG